MSSTEKLKNAWVFLNIGSSGVERCKTRAARSHDSADVGSDHAINRVSSALRAGSQPDAIGMRVGPKGLRRLPSVVLSDGAGADDRCGRQDTRATRVAARM